MAAVIGALRAELSAAIAQFQSDLGRAGVSLKAFAADAQEVANEINGVGTKMAIAITGPLLLLANAALEEATQMRQAMAQVDAALDSTGGTTGKTSKQLEELAGRLEDISTFSKQDILRGVTANLLQFSNISGTTFDRAEQLIVNFAARTGTDLQSATLKWGRALNDPIGGLNALTRSGVQFTTATKDQIKALVQSGQGLAAQNIILEEGERRFNGAAAALRAATPTAALEQSWRNLKDTIGTQLLPTLTPLLSDLEDLIKDFLALPDAAQQSIVKILAMAAGTSLAIAAFGQLIGFIASVVKLIGTLAIALRDMSFAEFLATLLAWGPAVLIVAAAVAALGAAIYESVQISKDATAAIAQEQSAHQELTDAMTKATAAGREMTAEERDAAAQKLKLAENTLKAALAQEQQNLAENERKWNPNNTGLGFVENMGTNMGDVLTGNLPTNIKMMQENNAITQLQKSLADNQSAQQDLFSSAATPTAAKTNFDLHNEDSIKKLQDATKEFEQAIQGMDLRVAHGLDELQLPKSIATANQLNAQIDAFVDKAQKAGVNTGAWAAQIAALRTKIAAEEVAALAKEAQKFGEQVDADAVAVDKYAKGGLDPLTERLQAVDDQYKQLRDKIQDEIDQNAALAAVNDDAAKAMERLKSILAGLGTAHDKATASAKAQYAAEQALAHLQAQGAALDTEQSITAFKRSLGQGSAVSSAQEDLQNTQAALAKQQSDAEIKLAELVKERQALEYTGSQQQKDDLDHQIDLQTQLAALVKSTTAEQLDGAKRVNDAIKGFTDSLSQDLSDEVVSGKLDFQKLFGDLEKLGENLFVKPFMDQVASVLGSLIKNLLNSFAGGFAGGGWIGPGQWGIVGEEGPEVAYGGANGMNIRPMATGASGNGSGIVVNQYISTPDYGAFRASKRQIARQTKKGLGIS